MKLSIKKKILIGVGILLGIMMVLVAIGSNYSPAVDEQGDILRESYPLGDKYNPARTDQTVIVGDVAYKMTSWHEAKKLEDTFDSTTAQGIFIVVDLQIENKGTQSIQISNNYFKLVDSQGRKFDTDNAAWVQLENNLVLKQLQPSLPINGQLVFDVPNSAVDTTYNLEITAISGHDKKYILL